MLRFSKLLLSKLPSQGLAVDHLAPEQCLTRFAANQKSLFKWFGYVDKFILFPRRLRTFLRQSLTHGKNPIVHICDHSNAMYSKSAAGFSISVTTCHDMLAVLGALGREPDCPASTTGRYLQKWILNGLASSRHVVCVSNNTRRDLEELLPSSPRPELHTVYNGLNHSYSPMQPEESQRLMKSAGAKISSPFLLHVGSGQPRKNRETILKVFAQVRERYPAQMVFAGSPLTDSQSKLATDLKISEFVREVVSPSNELLNALYSEALALLFPSRSEGFGWPIIEAQASGCPVVTSNRTSIPEIVLDTGLTAEPDDVATLTEHCLTLTKLETRNRYRGLGLQNALRFTTDSMIEGYIHVYRAAAAQKR
ncbi:MAG: glycosyltransferase family 1 protein [Verrucomicrobiota bacterium]|nr:glycosyltransferase family 1 protein [Verrucomicrobiota bacterium]